MSGKYDPPDKTRLVAANPSISSTCELMVAAAEAKFTPKAKRNDSATRKALKPQPTHQAKLVVWYLTTRVPLNLAAIPETEIVQACEWSNFPIETWQRQKRTFGLLQKVYAKRAAIRGQQQCQTPAPHSWTGPMLEDSQNHYL